MARQRRGGGFRPPELPLRGTLGTLLRTAAAQVGPLRDALERTAREGLREGRERLDDALAARASGSRRRAAHLADSERTDALADLGAIVLDLIRQGEIDLAELPEVRDIVAHLDDIDASSSSAASSAADAIHVDDDDDNYASPPSRNRFDSRRRDTSRSDDGSVSSKTWRPPPKKPAPKVWRPPLDNEEPPPPPPSPSTSGRPTDEITARGRPVPRPKDPLRKGGISFDDDDDLADYMHPDDVPSKPPKDGDS